MTTTTEIIDPRAVETLMLDGDLGKLDAAQRIQFYAATCDRVGLDPVARPFDYLRLNGKVVLYANKSCAEQLRQLHNISLGEVRTEVVNDTFIATVTASTPDGRTDCDMGAVPVSGLSGERLANAMLKGITKAKRRVTLSLVGLGMMDETEVVTIPGAERIAPEVMEDDDRNVPQLLKTVALPDGGKGSVEDDPNREDVKNVTSVSRESNDRGEWWVITFDEFDPDGKPVKFTTFSSTVASRATEAFSSDIPVRVKTAERISKKTGKKYTNIDSLDLMGGDA
tara:strand:+ start:328 stop:1173 length:846 start_codon:yes stop_codon:yes gene_type:complete